MKNIRITDKQDRALQQGESAMSIFFWAVFAALIAIWLCHDTSAGLTASLHHAYHQNDASTLALILDWF